MTPLSAPVFANPNRTREKAWCLLTCVRQRTQKVSTWSEGIVKEMSLVRKRNYRSRVMWQIAEVDRFRKELRGLANPSDPIHSEFLQYVSSRFNSAVERFEQVAHRRCPEDHWRREFWRVHNDLRDLHVILDIVIWKITKGG